MSMYYFKVTGFSRLGEGQEVYPSQELILDTSNSKGAKSKTLYSFGNNEAGMHSQKLVMHYAQLIYGIQMQINRLQLSRMVQ